MSEVDPLELNTLPSDPRVAALSLLGMAAAELKELDSRVVGGSQSIAGTKTDLRKIVNDISKLQPSPVPQITTSNGHSHTTAIDYNAVNLPSSQQTPAPQPPTVNLVQQQPIPQQISDPNQLEFDFYKKIKPEDLEIYFKKINSKLHDLNLKLDTIMETISNLDKVTKKK